MDIIRINGILTRVLDIELIEAIGLLRIIIPDRLCFTFNWVAIGDLKNPIIVGKIKRVEEEKGMFYQYDIWFDYIKKPDNEIPSFRCKFCRQEYEGKPNFQVKDTEDFVCDKCRGIQNYPKLTWIEFIPLDKEKIVKDSVKITIFQCAGCKEVMTNPEFKTGYFEDGKHICSLLCADILKEKDTTLEISKYQKLKGDK